MEIKFTRIAGLKGRDIDFIITHDYGRSAFRWQDVRYAFAASIKNLKGLAVPMLLFNFGVPEEFYYINGSKITRQLFSFAAGRQGKNNDSSTHTISRTVDLQERHFRWVAEEICARLTAAYIDKPLIHCIRSNNFNFPSFNSMKDSAGYGLEIMNSSTPGQGGGIPDSQVRDEELLKVSAPAMDREDWKEGTVIEGRYTVQEVKRGGMGVVYVVFDSQSVKYYAMKTFQERHLWNEKIIKSIVREAEIWIGLEHHPNIVKAELVKVIEGKPYIFLEYVPGISLDEHMKTERLSLKEAVEFAIQICEGMKYAYDKMGLVHRDIKPSNCLITNDGVLKITDFGLGKIFEESLDISEQVPFARGQATVKSGSSSSIFAGTLPFIAPEVFKDLSAYTVKIDIYAFGVVLYMMLTGINPFYDEVGDEVIVKHLSLVPEPPHQVTPGIPELLSRLVMKCLEKDPAARFESFASIGEYLKRIYGEKFGLKYRTRETKEVFSDKNWLNRGLSLASLNRHQEALAMFDEAIKNNSASTKARISKAISLLEINRLDEALTCLDEAKKLDPRNREAWFYEGEALARAGEVKKALHSLNHAWEIAPTDPDILASKGRLLSQMGKAKDAIACFSLALKENPKLLTVWNGKGKMHLELNQFEEASDCFLKAIEINPRYYEAWHLRGTTLFKMGFYREAMNAYKKSLSIQPNEAGDFVGIGYCYRSLGNIHQALLTFDRALRLKKDSMELYLARSGLFEDLSLFEEAQKSLKMALRNCPLEHNSLVRLARLSFKRSHFEDALSICTRVINEGRADWQITLLHDSSLCWLQEKKKVEAEIQQHTHVNTDLIYSDIASILGVFCDIEDSIGHLERVLQKAEDPHKLLLLARLQRICGRFPEARSAAEKVLKLQGESDGARRLLEALDKDYDQPQSTGQKKKGLLSHIFKRKAAKDYTAEESLERGLIAFCSGEFDEARDYLLAALDGEPTMYACLFFTGVAHKHLGQVEKGEELLQSFITRFPGSPGYYKYMILSAPVRTEQATLEKMYHKWIGLLPGEPYPWFSYLRYLVDNNRQMTASLLCQVMVEKYVNFWLLSKKTAEYWNLRGLIELFLEDTNRAYKFFRKSLSFDARNALARLGAGKCFEQMDIKREAQQAFKSLLGQESSSLSGMYHLANLSIKNKDEKEAFSTIENALEWIPDSLVLKCKKAQVYIEFDNYQDFFDYYSRIFHKDIFYPPLLMLRAKSLVHKGMLNEAASFMKSSLGANPDNIAFLKSVGLICLKLDMPERALECYQKVVTIDRLNYECYFGAAIALYKMDNYHDAARFIDKYLLYEPYDPYLWIYRGGTQFHLADFSRAELCFKRAIELSGDFSAAWGNLAICFYRQEKYREALQHAERALRIDKLNVYAWICRSLAQKKTGEEQEANRSIEQALFCSPQNAYGWLQKGIMEYEREDYPHALASFTKACEAGGKQSGLWYVRGITALQIGELNQAKKYFARALSLDNNSFLARVGQAVLYKLEDNTDSFRETVEKAEKDDPERFRKWHENFSCTANLLSTLPLYDELDFPFDLPIPFSIETVEPVQIFRYNEMDNNF